MADTVPLQSWVAECSWKGRKPFLVGTFFTRAGAYSEEARRVAESKAVEFFQAVLPVTVPPPDHIKLKPGAIFFVDQGEMA